MLKGRTSSAPWEKLVGTVVDIGIMLGGERLVQPGMAISLFFDYKRVGKSVSDRE